MEFFYLNKNKDAFSVKFDRRKNKSKKYASFVFTERLIKMDSYSESYQNGGSRREADLQGLSQNIGTNIQKILQNGK